MICREGTGLGVILGPTENQDKKYSNIEIDSRSRTTFGTTGITKENREDRTVL